ncbi:mitochondrial carrier [Cantharellus anzutake]|uniref:mitochondrial carrier n=1 Tax=Cantharellus anzutake TaxID=1750568 RepID=UPI00190901D5|nr:mitochondrial carrier [Cantharellus anzutake]KAF8344343.1 mitochondrial carrier [Cantharellus anzutake]
MPSEDGQKPSSNGAVRLVGAVAGMGSGLTKVAVGHGFDTIKTRLQCAAPGTYAGAIDCLVKTVRNESVFALYKGATPPAVGWAAIDSLLLGSLHNYRLLLVKNGFSEPIPNSDKTRLSYLGHGISGLMAGCTSALVATPVELIKVKLQLQLQRSVADRQFKGPIDAIRRILRRQGVTGMWQGLPASALFRANFFWMFLGIEVLMRSFVHFDGTPYEMRHGFKTFCSGGLASFAYWFFAMPADNIKNRIMSRDLNQPRIAIREVALHVYRTHGLRGFYSGFAPCVLRAFPANASAYFVYEGLMSGLGAEKIRA